MGVEEDIIELVKKEMKLDGTLEVGILHNGKGTLNPKGLQGAHIEKYIEFEHNGKVHALKANMELFAVKVGTTLDPSENILVEYKALISYVGVH